MIYRHAIRFALCGFFLCAIALPARQARGGSPQGTKAASVSASAREKTNVCTLLSSGEVEAVQGESVKETRPSGKASGGMVMSECLFITATSAKSVSVVLATPDSVKSSALTPRKFWQKQFHAPGEKKEELHATDTVAGDSETEREERSRPRRIQGLGEEAYWVGNPVAGALYVLRGHIFLRISVGGVREESARIEKSKVLARAAVKRL